MTAATDPRPRVLCVDDDAFMLNILSAYRVFHVESAKCSSIALPGAHSAE
jgi:hypothetical protein